MVRRETQELGRKRTEQESRGTTQRDKSDSFEGFIPRQRHSNSLRIRSAHCRCPTELLDTTETAAGEEFLYQSLPLKLVTSSTARLACLPRMSCRMTRDSASGV